MRPVRRKPLAAVNRAGRLFTYINGFSDIQCLSQLMEWSGRAPALPARQAGKGGPRQGARHVSETQLSDRRDRHRYRQELVPHRGPRSARRNRAAAEVVTRPGRSTARQPATVLNRYGGLRRRALSQSQAPNARPRRPTDAREIRAPLFEGTEE